MKADKEHSPIPDGCFTYDGEPHMIDRNKLYRGADDDLVAIVYSPGYGGGWSTWGYGIDATDARVAYLVMTGGFGRLLMPGYEPDEPHEVIVDGTTGYLYSSWYESESHGDKLVIRWLPPGTLYRIDEYDGAESVMEMGSYDWHSA